MVKVAIVDDEPVIRKSLSSLVEWKKINCEVVFTATDGIEALDKIKTIIPDLIISDVRMPRMDGITLATHLRRELPFCKIVLLSAYSDKQYLLSAISLKVMQYIEKPISIPEFQEQIGKIAREICTQSIETPIENSIQIKQEILQIITNSKNHDLVEKLKYNYPYHFKWNAIGKFQLVLFFLGHEINEQNDLLIRMHQEIFSVQKKIISSDSIMGFVSNDNFLLLGHEISSKEISNLSVCIKKFFLDENIYVSETDSEIFSNLNKAINIVEKTMEISKWRFYFGYDKNLTYEYCREISQKPVFDTQNEIDYRDKSKLSVLFSDIRTKQYRNIKEIQGYLYDIYQQMTLWSVNKNTVTERNFNCLILKEVESLLLYEIHVQDFPEIQNKKLSMNVDKAISYILWNYQNSNLSISMIAEELQLTEHYLCAIFKKDTGVTINKFITAARLEKVKRLLLTTNKKMFEIAADVGFSEANYLSAIFKKNFGISPSEYLKHQEKAPDFLKSIGSQSWKKE
jgi:two-component system response regulator YesN